MDSENRFREVREVPERFPSKEEIDFVLRRYIKGRKYKELRVERGVEGLYLYEIEVVLENGEKVEYNYQKARYNYRDQSLPTGARFSASIHSIKYDIDGMPYGGDTVANYLDGVWKYYE